jgi:nicotinate-nucleotide pyrophosphorylase (carboxylating)
LTPPGSAGPPTRLLDALVERAVREDLGRGDLTSRAVVPPGLRARGRIRARRACVACGIEVARRVFRKIDRRVRLRARVRDGRRVAPGAVLAEVEGPAASILAGERVALNFLQHLSGIATRARRCAEVARRAGAILLDTRKTHPGLRALEKYAVRCGGARNHRHGLWDAVLIKDNHVALAGGVAAAVGRARRALPGRPVTVEVDTLAQLGEAARAGARTALLDNFTPERLRRAVRLYGRRLALEASGGVTPARLRRIARTGVHRISMGALTHSVEWADIGLDLDPPDRRAPRRARR